MHCNALGVISRGVTVINYVYLTLKSLNQFSRMNNNKIYISLHQASMIGPIYLDKQYDNFERTYTFGKIVFTWHGKDVRASVL